MNSDDLPLEFWRSRIGVFQLFALSAALSAGGYVMRLYPSHRPGNSDAENGSYLFLFFGFWAVVSFLELLKPRRPALILTRDGFSVPDLFEGSIPWSGVQNSEPTTYRRIQTLTFTLYPSTSSRLVWKGWAKWVRTLGMESNARISFGLSHLRTAPYQVNDVDVSRIIEVCSTQIDAAKASQLSESERRALDANVAEPVTTLEEPYFAIGLSILLVAIFSFEIFSVKTAAHSTAPTADTLLAFGGMTPNAVYEGQWWRLFTAPLLHGSFPHLLFNCAALLIAGFQLERLIGSVWFGGTFAASALCGSLMSLAFNAPNLVSVGASGGIVGLFAASAVFSHHFPPGPSRHRLMTGAFQILLPSLIPIVTTQNGAKIDYAAHFGGAVGGLFMGFLLLRLWPRERQKLDIAKVPLALVVGFFLICAFALVPIVGQFGIAGRNRTNGLPIWAAPNWPSDQAQAKAQSRTYLAKYPRDPRVRQAHASLLTDIGDFTRAELELRAILADEETLVYDLFPDIETRVRLDLAVLLMNSSRLNETRNIVRPTCRWKLSDELKSLRDKLDLCRGDR